MIFLKHNSEAPDPFWLIILFITIIFAVIGIVRFSILGFFDQEVLDFIAWSGTICSLWNTVSITLLSY